MVTGPHGVRALALGGAHANYINLTPILTAEKLFYIGSVLIKLSGTTFGGRLPRMGSGRKISQEKPLAKKFFFPARDSVGEREVHTTLP